MCQIIGHDDVLFPIKTEYKLYEYYQRYPKSPLWMHQKAPRFGTMYAPTNIAEVLDISTDDIDDRFPIQEVSTGTPFIIMPLKNLQAVQSAEVNLRKFKDILASTHRELGADAFFIFCPETIHSQNDIHARAFVHLHGIPEDPATGAANGNFAGWLAKYRYFGDSKVDVRVEQGYQVKRPSLLMLKADDTGGNIDVQVGGRVQLIARGELVD